jgi:hypothetical protein
VRLQDCCGLLARGRQAQPLDRRAVTGAPESYLNRVFDLLAAPAAQRAAAIAVEPVNREAERRGLLREGAAGTFAPYTPAGRWVRACAGRRVILRAGGEHVTRF